MNPNCKRYKDYGGRGIKICDRWLGYYGLQNFIDDMGPTPTDEKLPSGRSIWTIDRIDNSKGYSPDNCRFVSPKSNSRNRRNTKHLTIKGETKCVTEWCEILAISPFTVYWWIREKGKEYAEQRLSEIT